MPRLKMFVGLPRRTDISKQQFHDHWRHPHGSLARNITAIRDYVQSHQIPCDLLGAEQSLYEGIAEILWESDRDAMALPTNPDYAEGLAPDEPNFIDKSRMFFLFTQEELLQTMPGRDKPYEPADHDWIEDTRSTSIKLLQFIRAEDDAGFGRDDDLALGQRLGAFRHALCRQYRPLHPDGHPFIGVREVWWPTRTAFERGVARDRAAFDSLMQRAGASVSLLALAERFV